METANDMNQPFQRDKVDAGIGVCNMVPVILPPKAKLSFECGPVVRTPSASSALSADI